MDFDQLHTFLEIVRLKSFSKAAQTCFRTQPAISAQIRQMEQELGTQLFERFGSRISLTTAGKIFADYCQRILETKDQAFDEIRELEKVPRGQLTIAANEATCLKVLPSVFSNFKKRYPGIQLQVVRSYGTKTVQGVLDNSVDFGLAQIPVQDKKIEVVQVHTDEICLMVSKDHPLASRTKVDAEAVVEHTLLLPKGGRTRTRINEFLEDYEDDLKISMELESSEMMKQFIAADLGVGFVAMSHAREELASGELVALRLEPLPMTRTIGLIYRKDKALSRAAIGFIETVAEFARDSDKPAAAAKPKAAAPTRKTKAS